MPDLTFDLNELVRELQTRVKASKREKDDLKYIFGRLFQAVMNRETSPAEEFLRIYGVYTKGVSRFTGRVDEPYLSSGVYRMFVSTNRGSKDFRKVAVVRNPLESPIEESLTPYISDALQRRDTNKEVIFVDRVLEEPKVSTAEYMKYYKKHLEHHRKLTDLIGEMVVLFEKFLFEHLDLTEDLFSPLIKLTDDGYIYIG